MHPLFILIPIATLSLAPKWWAVRVLKQHNQREAFTASAAQLARDWLDRNQLQEIGVEITDLGDHYDPETRTVRLSRDKHGRKTLTAVTTAAHEVAHALQHDEDYAPFVWRNYLARLAISVGQVGTVMLLSVPVAAVFGRRPIPPMMVGSVLWLMLGSGVAAQFTALLSELDASFKRALPLVQEAGVNDAQFDQAKRILLACSLTYAASSLLSVLHFWPWLGRAGLLATQQTRQLENSMGSTKQPCVTNPITRSRRPWDRSAPGPHIHRHNHDLVRTVGKPIIRVWFRLIRHPHLGRTRYR